MRRSVIFDIGVVLLHIDYASAVAAALPLCDPRKGLNARKFFSLIERDPAIAEYERGRLSSEDFHRHFVELTGFSGSLQVFTDMWMGMLSENEPMIRFARSLTERYDVFFATNAGFVHIPGIYERFPDLRFYKDAAASCFLGAVKPEAEFYRKALAQFGVRAEDCLFIDDRPENVAGAEAFGIRSVLYTNPGETIAAVRAALGG